jgi:hypothetical protein
MKEEPSMKKSSPLLRPAYWGPLASLSCLVLTSGCGRAPTFNILGSFFPAWLICMLAGIVLAFGANRLLAYLKIDNEIMWSILVYPCLAFFFACVLWLIFFS